MSIANYFKNYRAESLLEITIAMSLALIIITAVATTTLNGLKNSQLSQNQVQATKLAQEGLEKVKYIRGRNCPIEKISGSVTTQYSWFGDAADEDTTTDPNNPKLIIWNHSFSVGETFEVDTSACKIVEKPTDPITSTTTATKFTRVIKIEDESVSNPAIKKITSVVSWTDFTGSHESKLITVLTQN